MKKMLLLFIFIASCSYEKNKYFELNVYYEDQYSVVVVKKDSNGVDIKSNNYIVNETNFSISEKFKWIEENIYYSILVNTNIYLENIAYDDLVLDVRIE